jgi:hypothetical protein
MISLTCPGEIRKVADRFKDVAGISYSNLCQLLAAMTFKTNSISEAVRHAGWMSSVSALTNAASSFDRMRFMQRMCSGILNRYKSIMAKDRFCFAVDDTIVLRSGKKIFGVGFHPRHGQSGVVRAQRVIVLFLVDRERGVAFPLAFAMCLNKHCENYKSCQDLCFDLVKQVIDFGFPKLVTVVDAGFDSVPLVKKFDSEGLAIVFESKMNRTVKPNPAPNGIKMTWKEALHKRIKAPVKLKNTHHCKQNRRTKYIAARRVQLNGRCAQFIAAAVYNNPRDANFFAVYCSNDLDISGADLWEYSRARWHVEEAFRALKQSIGFLGIGWIGENACYTSICLPFALLNSIHMEPELWGGDLSAPVGRLMRQFLDRMEQNAIQKLINGDKLIAALRVRKRRLCKKNAKKPVNPSAEEVRAYFSYVA